MKNNILYDEEYKDSGIHKVPSHLSPIIMLTADLNTKRYVFQYTVVVDTDLVRECLKRRPDWVSAAKLGGLEASDNVLQCGSHHKVLLFQA